MAIEFDAEVRRLLFERVASYEQLEALLLLRAESAQSFSAQELAARLRIDEFSVTSALEALTADRLLERRAGPPVTYRYRPADALSGSAVDRLARLYEEQRLEVIRQMSANAIELSCCGDASNDCRSHLCRLCADQCRLRLVAGAWLSGEPYAAAVLGGAVLRRTHD
jgi:hypothetical protein